MHYMAIISTESHSVARKRLLSLNVIDSRVCLRSSSLLYSTNYLAVIFMKYKRKMSEVMGHDQTHSQIRSERSWCYPIQESAQWEKTLLQGARETFSVKLYLALPAWLLVVTCSIIEGARLIFVFLFWSCAATRKSTCFETKACVVFQMQMIVYGRHFLWCSSAATVCKCFLPMFLIVFLDIHVDAWTFCVLYQFMLYIKFVGRI